MKRTLQQIAEAVGASMIGDGRPEVSAVASMDSATPQDLVFVEDEKHLAAALKSQAGAIIAGDFAERLAEKLSGKPGTSASFDRPLLISDHPKLAFARAA